MPAPTAGVLLPASTRRTLHFIPWICLTCLLNPAFGQPATRPATSAPSGSLETARELMLQGYYDGAIAEYEAAAKRPGQLIEAAVGRSEIDLQTGKYQEGIARLESLKPAGDTSPDWHAALADLLEQVGEYDSALHHNRAALEIDKEHYRARWQLGRLQEMLGQADEAIATFKPFEDIMLGPALPESAEDLTRLGQGFYRYCLLTRHPDMVRRTQHVLKDVYQEAFEFVDADYWPARLAAAELLLEKFNLEEAESDFKRIRQQNEKLADAAAGIGLIALVEKWDFETAERMVSAALAGNPNHVGAHLLLAQSRMTERRYRAAAGAANKALEVNPRSIPALSLLAAAQLRSGEVEASNQTQARVRAITPKPAFMHYTLALWLAMSRQFDEAEPHFKKAIEMAPAWSAPRTELGLMYMEMGEEASARQTLDSSFSLDSFNRRTFNVLELLDELEKYDRVTTKNFIIKHDREDAVLSPYFADALEGLHDDVCGDFKTKLDKPTSIEVFPSHERFSVRISGRPFIATVGACTGPCIAMVAPRGRAPFGRFNWAGVLRHEFTHTVTLAATGNRIPHWFTEGLAVHEEKRPRSWDWKQLLSDALRGDRLFSLSSIDWGFQRPRRGDDRTLAYAQSEWMVEYIIEKHKYDAILELLKAFKDRKTQAQAFRDVLNISQKDFSAAFVEWAGKQVESWHMPARRVESREKIKALLLLQPRDAALHGRLAEAELLEGDHEAAEEAAREAIKRDKNERTGLAVLCRILIGKMLAEKEESARRDLMEQADPLVRRLYKLDPKHPVAIKLMGYAEQHDEQWREALDLFAEYQQHWPEDPDPYRRSAGIYLVLKRPDKALEQLERLSAVVDDEPAVLRQIAEMYLERGEPSIAAKWLRSALEIDPYDATIHQMLGEASLQAADLVTAQREFETMCRMMPGEAVGYEGLGRVFEALGNTAKAKELRERAEALGGVDQPEQGTP